MRSIAHRIYKAIFAISVLCVLLLVSTVLLINEDLEDTLLGVNPVLQAPTDIPLGSDLDHAFLWDSTLNKIAYIPHNSTQSLTLPDLFLELGPRTHAEIERDGSTYLVNAEHYAEGTLYWARNIDAFETREKKLDVLLLVIVLLILGLSFLLALYGSRKIVQPLQNLSQQIHNLPIKHDFAVLEANYQDRELNEIAQTFNFFLAELEAHIQREKHLLNLASHELRTPIAVISGALDVIETRQQLAPNDLLTLTRIRRANEEMKNNVTILLQLARGEVTPSSAELLDLYACVHEIIDDLAASHSTTHRIHVTGQAHLKTHASLVKMLLRNLIQNSLQHTTGHIQVSLSSTAICIRDEGSANSAVLPWPTTNTPPPSSGGLGLYLVTLMCEKLNWQLTTQALEHAGTQITLSYNHPFINA